MVRLIDGHDPEEYLRLSRVKAVSFDKCIGEAKSIFVAAEAAREGHQNFICRTMPDRYRHRREILANNCRYGVNIVIEHGYSGM